MSEKRQGYEASGSCDQKGLCGGENQTYGVQIVHHIFKLGNDSLRVPGRRNTVWIKACVIVKNFRKTE